MMAAQAAFHIPQNKCTHNISRLCFKILKKIKSRSMSLVPWDSGFILIELFLNANMIIIKYTKKNK